MPKDVSIPVEKWTGSLYKAPEGSLAPPEASKLTLMSSASAGGISAASSDEFMKSAVQCMQEGGDVAKCQSHLDALARLGGYTEPEVKGNGQKASEFCNK